LYFILHRRIATLLLKTTKTCVDLFPLPPLFSHLSQMTAVCFHLLLVLALLASTSAAAAIRPGFGQCPLPRSPRPAYCPQIGRCVALYQTALDFKRLVFFFILYR
jgi:hypothetical protein